MVEVHIYTDGACAGNGQPRNKGGWAAAFISGSRQRIIGGYARNTTNNRMETMAVLKALAYLKQPADVVLHTDSQYVISCLSKVKQHKVPAKNGDLWSKMLDQVLRHKSVTVMHIRGHQNVGNANDTVDQIATSCAEQQVAVDFLVTE